MRSRRGEISGFSDGTMDRNSDWQYSERSQNSGSCCIFSDGALKRMGMTSFCCAMACFSASTLWAENTYS